MIVVICANCSHDFDLHTQFSAINKYNRPTFCRHTDDTGAYDCGCLDPRTAEIAHIADVDTEKMPSIDKDDE